jgi:hypothetical protein
MFAYGATTYITLAAVKSYSEELIDRARRYGPGLDIVFVFHDLASDFRILRLRTYPVGGLGTRRVGAPMGGL